MYDLVSIGKGARAAAAVLRTLDTAKRNAALAEISRRLCENMPAILEANRTDVAAATNSGMKSAMIDRLILTSDRIEDIAKAVLDIAALHDPIGAVDFGETRPNGIQILKMRVPIGVISIIYEARPNVTVDAAAICLKSGNACILRGGKEAYATNRVLVMIMRKALEAVDMPADSICFIEDTSHDTAQRLMRLNGYIDLLIPRGSAKLIKAVVESATVPVIETGAGNCHMYVDKYADLDMAVKLADNAKTQRPSVCNAIETLLVHRDIAADFLPKMKAALDRHNVEIRGCPTTRVILKDAKPATDEDWTTEYDDYILAVKVVNSIDEAISHIAKYSTGHSECIVTDSVASSHKFISMIDAAAVYVNASTRFTDGGEFGFGAEIGISTQKLHARGPMGLKELTTVKYVVTGDGQIRV